MFMEDYNERQYMKNVRELSYQYGKRAGKTELLVQQVLKKMKKGEGPEAIARELEEDSLTVAAICRAAGRCAPEYDCEEIQRMIDPGSRRDNWS